MGRRKLADALVRTMVEAFLDPIYLRFREDFASVLDPRTHTIEWLDGQIWAGRVKVWGDDRACLLTEIRYFPVGSFDVHVMIAAGSRKVLVDEVILEVEAWARQVGALFVSIASREAWARIMAPQGYESWQHEIRKEA